MPKQKVKRGLKKEKGKKQLEILTRGKSLVSQITNPNVSIMLNKFVNYYDDLEHDNDQLNKAFQNIILHLGDIVEHDNLNDFDLEKIKTIKREIKNR